MVKKPKIYFKVIRKKDRNSSLIKSRVLRVKYLVNEWVRPQLEGSKLMVFNNRNIAVDWMRGWSCGRNNIPELIMVSCIIRNPCHDRLSIVYNIFEKQSTKKIREFWANWKNRRGCVSSVDGSVYVSAVKCLE